MHTLAFVNQKGGCGKTTATVNLAGALAHGGARVLVVDLDPQAHATMALSCAVEGRPGLAEVFLDGASMAAAVQRGPGDVELVPATLRLAEYEDEAGRRVRPERVLSHALSQLEGEYDFALVDCPPRADGVLTANALRACDTAVLVVETGAFALQGALRATQILEALALDTGADFRLRVLGTLYDQDMSLSRELLVATQARFGPLMFDTVIHENVRLREAAAYGVPVQLFDPSGAAALDFEALAEEVWALSVAPESCEHPEGRSVGRVGVHRAQGLAPEAPVGDPPRVHPGQRSPRIEPWTG